MLQELLELFDCKEEAETFCAGTSEVFDLAGFTSVFVLQVRY